MKKLSAYKEQSQNTFLLEKLKEVQKERDDFKSRFAIANMYRAFWKTTTLILLAIFLGRILGGAL
jgi:hypothetical protein